MINISSLKILRRKEDELREIPAVTVLGLRLRMNKVQESRVRTEKYFKIFYTTESLILAQDER